MKELKRRREREREREGEREREREREGEREWEPSEQPITAERVRSPLKYVMYIMKKV